MFRVTRTNFVFQSPTWSVWTVYRVSVRFHQQFSIDLCALPSSGSDRTRSSNHVEIVVVGLIFRILFPSNFVGCNFHAPLRAVARWERNYYLPTRITTWQQLRSCNPSLILIGWEEFCCEKFIMGNLGLLGRKDVWIIIFQLQVLGFKSTLTMSLVRLFSNLQRLIFTFYAIY